MHIQNIKPVSAAFPERLKTIVDPPANLFVMGDLGSLLTLPTLAVIGSRRVTAYGRQVTDHLTRELAGQGVVIISGLAIGVDGLAHQAALDAGGKTIAVLPGGLDRIYPSTHYHLAQEILAKGGAVISEYPEGSEPYPVNFIARNRLVSALSDGVLITEAAAKSGTLHTANFALQQGKTVMAVPGSIHNSMSAGTNNLIKSGAVPVTEVNDILFILGLDAADKQVSIFGANQEETIILELLKSGLTDSTDLLAKSKLPVAAFNQTLTMLELSGKIKPAGAGHWLIK